MGERTAVKPYPTLRAETEKRDRGLQEKAMSLEDAASLVDDGEQVEAIATDIIPKLRAA